MEQQKGSTSKEMIWALRWSVALRTFYRQILSLLYSSFPFGNFRPRLVRALLVYVYIISSLVSIEFVDSIRKLRRRASAKLLQTLLTIGESAFSGWQPSHC